MDKSKNLNENSNIESISLQDWLKLGEQKFGKNRDDWQFVCVMCGHIQSATASRERQPNVDKGKEEYWLRNYLAMNCEGRLSNDVGCDWSLGGLFQIHKSEVVDGEKVIPVMEFA